MCALNFSWIRAVSTWLIFFFPSFICSCISMVIQKSRGVTENKWDKCLNWEFPVTLPASLLGGMCLKTSNSREKEEETKKWNLEGFFTVLWNVGQNPRIRGIWWILWHTAAVLFALGYFSTRKMWAEDIDSDTQGNERLFWRRKMCGLSRCCFRVEIIAELREAERKQMWDVFLWA